MVYFYSSSDKADQLVNPIAVGTKRGEARAYALAAMNFAKHNMLGKPKRVTAYGV